MGGLTFSLQSKVMMGNFLSLVFALNHESQGREAAIRGLENGVWRRKKSWLGMGDLPYPVHFPSFSNSWT